MLDRTFRYISVVLALLGLTLALTLTSLGKLDLPWMISIAILFSIAVTLFIGVFLRFLERNPTTLTISLLGFPSAGKTVYLTILFDELQRTQETGIQFAPYGQETVEQVTDDLNTLSKGTWLLPTKPGTVFYYRANTSIGTGLSQRRYKIEIADFAGESIGELDSSSEKWLHKSDYFKYVIKSEAVLFAIDCQVLIKGDRVQIEKMQNAFVAALQILAESKGATEKRQLKTPIALLFLKTDLLKDKIEEEELLTLIPRLLDVCKRRCANFSYFFVSSVGKVGAQGSPPETPKPRNVVAPIVWILRRMRGI